MNTIPAEVVRHYAMKNAMTSDEALSIFGQLEQFLDEAQYGRCSPTEQVDNAWHEFILHTQHYIAYCKERFGKIIHHVPDGPAHDASEIADCSSKCSSACTSRVKT